MRKITSLLLLLISSISLFACSRTSSSAHLVTEINEIVDETNIEREAPLQYHKLDNYDDLTGSTDGALFLSEDLKTLKSHSNIILVRPEIDEDRFEADYAAFLYIQSDRVNILVFPKKLLLNHSFEIMYSTTLSDSLDLLVRRWIQDMNDMSIRMIDVATAPLPDYPMLPGAESQLLYIASLLMPIGNGQEQDFMIKNHLITKIPTTEGHMFSLEVNTILFNDGLKDDLPLSLVQNLQGEKHANLIAWDANGPSERVLPMDVLEKKNQEGNSFFYSLDPKKLKADDDTFISIDASRGDNSYVISLTRDQGFRNAEIELNMAAIFNIEDKDATEIYLSSDTVVRYASKMSTELPSMLRIPLT